MSRAPWYRMTGDRRQCYCEDCGVPVVDRTAHTRFHATHARLPEVAVQGTDTETPQGTGTTPRQMVSDDFPYLGVHDEDKNCKFHRCVPVVPETPA
jgi:hypothetical protein